MAFIFAAASFEIHNYDHSLLDLVASYHCLSKQVAYRIFTYMNTHTAVNLAFSLAAAKKE